VQGSDGMRVPLLRPGFRPTGAYPVSFVIMHAGTPFAKKGDSELSLPKMDIPISILRWEVFLPEKYKVKNFAGDAIAANRLPPGLPMPVLYTAPQSAAAYNNQNANTQMPRGTQAPGIALVRDGININEVRWDAGIQTPDRINPDLVQEMKVILSPADAEYGRGAGQVQLVGKTGGGGMGGMGMNASQSQGSKNTQQANSEASSNVVNLQRRVAGVLPIRVDVPRTGSSYSFIRPLLIDEETKVTFRYKSK
jgi:hypothetical protein